MDVMFDLLRGRLIVNLERFAQIEHPYEVRVRVEVGRPVEIVEIDF